MRTDELAIMRTDELAIERYTRQPLPTLRDIVAVLFRQRWPMLAAFALVVIAVAVSGVWIPKYEAQMKILALRQRSDAIVTSSANAPLSSAATKSARKISTPKSNCSTARTCCAR